MDFNTKYYSIIKIIKKYHDGQFRCKGNVPYYFHCQNVGEIIFETMLKTQEIEQDTKLFNDIVIAACGHDLYEDTKIKRKDIINEYNNEVDELIFLLTNEQGDNDRAKYMEKIKNAPEEAKLIKLCDQIDNALGAAYNIYQNGTEWSHGFLLPILKENIENSKCYKFIKYPKTGKILTDLFTFSFNRYIQILDKYLNK